MLPSLPQEIVDLIVDALAVQNDASDYERFRNLQSSALVSRTFTVRARYHLFSSLTMRWIPKSKYERPTLHRTQQLREFLETDPIFLKSIQTLDIGIPVPLHSNMLKQITGIHSGLSEIITLLYSTPTSRLHTLILTGFTESILDSEAGSARSDTLMARHRIPSGSLQSLSFRRLAQLKAGLPSRRTSGILLQATPKYQVHHFDRGLASRSGISIFSSSSTHRYH